MSDKKINESQHMHKFMLRIPMVIHEKICELRHEKKFYSVQEIYNAAIKKFLEENNKI